MVEKNIAGPFIIKEDLTRLEGRNRDSNSALKQLIYSRERERERERDAVICKGSK